MAFDVELLGKSVHLGQSKVWKHNAISLLNQANIFMLINLCLKFQDFEKKVIQATALIQQTTDVPITFHPGRNPEAPFEIIRIFTEAGGKSEDVVMSHLDRNLRNLLISSFVIIFLTIISNYDAGTIFDDGALLEFAKLKTFTQFDLFGTECSYYQLQESIDMISDAQRVDKLRMLSDNGHLEQITMSHDIHTKHRLVINL
jgi:phosphotriesterase-related protein